MLERQVVKGLLLSLGIIGLMTFDKRFLAIVEGMKDVLGLDSAFVSISTLRHLSEVFERLLTGVGKFVFPSAFNCKPKLKINSTSSRVSSNSGIFTSCNKSFSTFCPIWKVWSQRFSICKKEWSEIRSSVFSSHFRELTKVYLNQRKDYKIYNFMTFQIRFDRQTSSTVSWEELHFSYSFNPTLLTEIWQKLTLITLFKTNKNLLSILWVKNLTEIQNLKFLNLSEKLRQNCFFKCANEKLGFIINKSRWEH